MSTKHLWHILRACGEPLNQLWQSFAPEHSQHIIVYWNFGVNGLIVFGVPMFQTFEFPIDLRRCASVWLFNSLVDWSISVLTFGGKHYSPLFLSVHIRFLSFCDFCPRDAMRPYIRPVSVRPSVTLADCIHTAEDIVKLLVRPASSIALVFWPPATHLADLSRRHLVGRRSTSQCERQSDESRSSVYILEYSIECRVLEYYIENLSTKNTRWIQWWNYFLKSEQRWRTCR